MYLTRLAIHLLLFLSLSVPAEMVQAQSPSPSRGIGIKPVEKKAQTAFDQGHYRALVIGNNEYIDNKGVWRSLKTAQNDARAVAKLLTESYGFSDVKLLENATRKEVLNAIESLSRRVMSQDNVLIYYAGHGFLDTETNKGFWVPVDAQGMDNTTFLRHSTIRDEMTGIAFRAKHTLLISDSCFSGALLRSGTRGPSPGMADEKYYKKVASKKSVQIMAAGGEEYVDDNYKASGHSPFTYFLLSELQNNNSQMLSSSELSSNVKKAVANNVDQVPESGVLQGAGDELGEFIFIKLKVGVKGVPAEKVKVEVDIVPFKEPAALTAPRKSPAQLPDESQSKIIPIPTL
ncbi:hypothetical protein MNBD_GAMMA11-3433 [hydrothermal vent metagenome]|uniref:Peptidase C14 caspase domain-containing protein n=1 Tax=hydrothermal vent metagenome TaxID=652676 RepID=A0A3B0XCL0_9ZZZZ